MELKREAEPKGEKKAAHQLSWWNTLARVLWIIMALNPKKDE